MRFLLTTMYDTHRSGGLSTFMHNLAKGLRKRKHDVVIVDEQDAGAVNLLVNYKLLRNGLYVLKKDWGMRWYFSAAQRMLRAQILANLTKETIIITVDPVAYMSIADIPNPKYLVVQGDLTNMCLSDNVITKGGSAERVALEIERKAYTQAKHVVTCDTRLYNHVRQFVKRTPTIMKNFVDEETFVPLPESSRKELRKRLGMEGFVVFCPRRLVPKNGVVFAAQAMKLLKGENITLIFAGSGSEKGNISSYASKNRLDNILLLGDVSHETIMQYYQACDCVIIPSITSSGVIEATSISALEGMACERPVIASAIGGLAELITDGKNGLLVPEQDPARLAEAIRTVAKDRKLATKLGKTARKFILKNNSIASQTAHYLKLFSH